MLQLGDLEESVIVWLDQRMAHCEQTGNTQPWFMVAERIRSFRKIDMRVDLSFRTHSPTPEGSRIHNTYTTMRINL